MSFDWQYASRICAWIDLVQVVILGILVIFALCTVFSLYCGFKLIPSSDVESQTQGGSTLPTIILTVVSLILLACVAFNLWVAILLFQATASDVDPESALSKCKTWRIVTIVVLILTALGDLSNKKYVQAIVPVIVRGIFLYIVSRYITELQDY